MYPQASHSKTKVFTRKVTTVFTLSKEELKELSEMGWVPFRKFQQGTATKQDWFEMTLRVKFALELSKDHYELVTTLELEQSHKACLAIMERAVVEGTGIWSMTEQEAALISAALEAVDEMQTQVPRRIMAPILRRCVVEMRRKYVKDEKLAPLLPKSLK